MIKFIRFFVAMIFFANLVSCGSKEQEDEQKNVEESTIKTETKKTEVTTLDSINNSDYDSISATKESILRKQHYKRRKDGTIYDSIPFTTVEKTKELEKLEKSKENKTSNEVKKSSFVLKKIINECKTGETLTQKELTANHDIPKDAIQLVKSITKVSEDELDIKWQSTWLVEKMSDAKFKDGRIKVLFKDNKMYTSGNAIGIKYKRKIYTDLIVTGNKTRIPGIKGYYWEIGK